MCTFNSVLPLHLLGTVCQLQTLHVSKFPLHCFPSLYYSFVPDAKYRTAQKEIDNSWNWKWGGRPGERERKRKHIYTIQCVCVIGPQDKSQNNGYSFKPEASPKGEEGVSCDTIIMQRLNRSGAYMRYILS